MGPSTTKEFVYVTGREEGRSALPTMCGGRGPLRKEGMGEGGLRFHSRPLLYVRPLRVRLRTLVNIRHFEVVLLPYAMSLLFGFRV